MIDGERTTPRENMMSVLRVGGHVRILTGPWAGDYGKITDQNDVLGWKVERIPFDTSFRHYYEGALEAVHGMTSDELAGLASIPDGGMAVAALRISLEQAKAAIDRALDQL
jgi:hypothetical protein